MSESTNQTNTSKRLLKVYKGHYCSVFRRVNEAYPLIRLGGKYLSKFDFQIGDEIEVQTERGKIVITKMKNHN